VLNAQLKSVQDDWLDAKSKKNMRRACPAGVSSPKLKRAALKQAATFLENEILPKREMLERLREAIKTNASAQGGVDPALIRAMASVSSRALTTSPCKMRRKMTTGRAKTVSFIDCGHAFDVAPAAPPADRERVEVERECRTETVLKSEANTAPALSCNALTTSSLVQGPKMLLFAQDALCGACDRPPQYSVPRIPFWRARAHRRSHASLHAHHEV
jgi:hypothetical protein